MGKQQQTSAELMTGNQQQKAQELGRCQFQTQEQSFNWMCQPNQEQESVSWHGNRSGANRNRQLATEHWAVKILGPWAAEDPERCTAKAQDPGQLGLKLTGQQDIHSVGHL